MMGGQKKKIVVGADFIEEIAVLHFTITIKMKMTDYIQWHTQEVNNWSYAVSHTGSRYVLRRDIWLKRHLIEKLGRF